MNRHRLPRLARANIVDTLAWSAENFGDAARRRYRELLEAGLRDIAADPLRAGSGSRPEIGEGIDSWLWPVVVTGWGLLVCVGPGIS